MELQDHFGGRFNGDAVEGKLDVDQQSCTNTDHRINTDGAGPRISRYWLDLAGLGGGSKHHKHADLGPNTVNENFKPTRFAQFVPQP